MHLLGNIVGKMSVKYKRMFTWGG